MQDLGPPSHPWADVGVLTPEALSHLMLGLGELLPFPPRGGQSLILESRRGTSEGGETRLLPGLGVQPRDLSGYHQEPQHFSGSGPLRSLVPAVRRARCANSPPGIGRPRSATNVPQNRHLFSSHPWDQKALPPSHSIANQPGHLVRATDFLHLPPGG